MQDWHRNFAALAITQLRSPINAHCDPFDFRGLESYAQVGAPCLVSLCRSSSSLLESYALVIVLIVVSPCFSSSSSLSAFFFLIN